MPKHAWESDSDSSEPTAQAPRLGAGHSWDTPPATPAASAAAPEDQGNEGQVEEEEEQEEEGVDPVGTAEEAAEAFAQALLEHYYDSSLSAQAICTLAYYASKAGMPGLVNELAMRNQTGGTTTGI